MSLNASSSSTHVETDHSVRRTSSTKSNVLVKKSTKREQMESEVRALIAKQQEKDSKRFHKGCTVENMVAVTHRKHLKDLVCDVSYRATVVIFGSPECRSCMAMVPKLTQLAKQNDDIMFAKVNAIDKELRDIVEGLRVPKVPWFLIFQGKDKMVASFTANLNTIDVLRAEISNVKECLDHRCSL
jgi:thiol-disulfide isomerase/thioredoxin